MIFRRGALEVVVGVDAEASRDGGGLDEGRWSEGKMMTLSSFSIASSNATEGRPETEGGSGDGRRR
jgi:hypothetical protein